MNVLPRGTGWGLALLLAGSLITAHEASATILTQTYQLDQINTGGQVVTSPYGTVTLTANDVAGTVTAEFKVSANGLTNHATFSDIGLNTSASFTSASVTSVGSGSLAGWSVSTSTNPSNVPGQGLDGFGYFNIVGSTSNQNSTSDVTITVTGLTGNATTLLADFAKLSANPAGNGNVYFGAHELLLASNGGNGNTFFVGGSTPVNVVPEPATVVMAGSAVVLGLGVAWRRRGRLKI